MIESLAMKIRWRYGKRATFKEQASFEALVGSCWDALWRYAYRMAGNHDDAEDLLSETLIEGFKSFKQFRGETPFVRWMYRIMTTTRIDMTRRAKVRRAESLDALREASADERAPFDPPDIEADPQRVLLAPMLSEPVQKALDLLSEEFRAVVVLADMEQIDYAEVGRILQIPIGTVRSRLSRARALLRKSLGAYVNAPDRG